MCVYLVYMYTHRGECNVIVDRVARLIYTMPPVLAA